MFCYKTLHPTPPPQKKKTLNFYNCSTYLKFFLIVELSIWNWCWPKTLGCLISVHFSWPKRQRKRVCFYCHIHYIWYWTVKNEFLEYSVHPCLAILPLLSHWVQSSFTCLLPSCHSRFYESTEYLGSTN